MMKSLKQGFVPGAFFAALLLICAACETGGTIELGSLLVKNVEVKGNQINIYASRPLEPGVYILNDPQRMVVEVKNAALSNNAVKGGQGSGDMIKSWSLAELDLNQGMRDGEPVKSARLSVDLTRNVTYKLNSESFGCSLTLEDIKKTEEPAKTANMEVSRELYSQLGKSSPEAEREAREMLRQISSVSVGSVPPQIQNQLPQSTQPAISAPTLPKAKVVTDVSFSSGDGSFEVVISGDGAVTNYKYFKLDSPARAVVDIFGVRKAKSVKDTLLVNNDRVREIRVGAHSDYTRVVIELKGGFRDASASSTGSTLAVKIIY